MQDNNRELLPDTINNKNLKGAASRMEDLPYSLFHYRPILTTILLKAKIRIITCLDKRKRPFY